MPYAAPTRCTYLGPPRCRTFATHKSRCDEHQPSGWVERPRSEDKGRNTIERNDTTTTEWQTLWGNTMRDHNRICHVCRKPGADQVDHIIPVGLGGAKTDPANLAPIHSEPCHREKTARELAEMRRRKEAAKRLEES